MASSPQNQPLAQVFQSAAWLNCQRMNQPRLEVHPSPTRSKGRSPFPGLHFVTSVYILLVQCIWVCPFFRGYPWRGFTGTLASSCIPGLGLIEGTPLPLSHGQAVKRLAPLGRGFFAVGPYCEDCASRGCGSIIEARCPFWGLVKRGTQHTACRAGGARAHAEQMAQEHMRGKKRERKCAANCTREPARERLRGTSCTLA